MISGWSLVDEQGSWGQLHYSTIKIPDEIESKGAFQFHCSRNNDPVEARIYPIYKNAVEGNAHLNGERGALAENTVPVDRKTAPQVYLNFENQVILALTDSLKSPFELKLAIYNPGQLLGTEILLFRLVDYLKRKEVSGEIRLFLIDYSYNTSLSGVNYISQFAKDICLALPSSIQVQCTFFASREDYLQLASNNPHFKHHLLIGPETAKGFEAFSSGADNGKDPIKLSKVNSKVCELKLPGKFTDYYPEDNRLTAFKPIKESDDSTRNLIIGGGVILIAIGVAFLVRRTLNSK